MTHSTTSKWLLVFAVSLIALSARAQDAAHPKSSAGREFWVCFPQNAQAGENGSKLQLKLFITGAEHTIGEVEVPGLNFRKRFSVEAGGVATVELDTMLEVRQSEKVMKLGVHIEAVQDVTVFCLSSRRASSDSYLALPVAGLGTAYRAIGYTSLMFRDPGISSGFATEFAIVATDANTQVAIDLTGNTRGGKKKGDKLTVGLNKGEVYQVHGGLAYGDTTDLTGSLVTSSKPIGFMVGHSCAQVPASAQFCDQLLEMEPPISTWGKEFIVGKMTGKQEYALRVLASEDSTLVSIGKAVVATLKAGEFYEDNHMKDNAWITSSRPLLVAQYAQSASMDSIQVGDPFMMLVTPTQQFQKSYRISIPISEKERIIRYRDEYRNGKKTLTPEMDTSWVSTEWHHYLDLILSAGGQASVKIDGKPFDKKNFRSVASSQFSVCQYEVSAGTHLVTCDLPFGLYNYGFGVGSNNFDSYGNPCGQLLETINPPTPH